MEIKINETEYQRRIDDLGRVVIPKTVRQKVGIQEGDNFQIYISDEGIICFKNLSR